MKGFAPVHLQTPTPPTSAELEWWKGAGLFVLGVVSSFVGFRTRLYSLKRDIDDEKAKREQLASTLDESVRRIEKLITDHRDDRANATASGLNAIRRDNDEHHRENRERLKVMREQMLVVLRLCAKIARAVPGMNQPEIDDAMGNFLSLELERAD